MPERIKIESTANTKEDVEFLPYFPTDLERAKNGLEKFNEVFERSEVLRKAAEDGRNRKILLSTMGLFPEIGFYGGTGFDRMETEQERKELQRIYEEEFDLKLLFWDEPAEGKQWQCSIINPSSVEKVIKNCPIPDLFPEEARRDPVKWVLSNKFEWDDPCSDGDFNDEDISKRAVRFGILSGYAPRASAAYPDFKLAEKAIVNKLSEKEQKFYSEYVRSEKDGRKLSGPLEGLLASSVEKGVISSFQAKLLRNIIVHKDMTGVGYGFFDEDEKYFDNIKTILDKYTTADLNDEDIAIKLLESVNTKELEKLQEFHGFSADQIKLYKYFAALRKRAHDAMEKDLTARLKKNPQPTAEELNLGTFKENLEPQVRKTVLALRKKGYNTYESGFHGLNKQKISFEKKFFENFSLTSDLEKTLRLKDVSAEMSVDSITLTLDRALTLVEMQTIWGAVGKSLPDLKRNAEPSTLFSSESFRKRFMK